MPTSFDSEANTEHPYQVIDDLCEGGQGAVKVTFKYDLDDRPLGIFACKFIKQSYIDAGEARVKQLEREIQIMREADPATCL